jgi:hypothetical protein
VVDRELTDPFKLSRAGVNGKPPESPAGGAHDRHIIGQQVVGDRGDERRRRPARRQLADDVERVEGIRTFAQLLEEQRRCSCRTIGGPRAGERERYEVPEAGGQRWQAA